MAMKKFLCTLIACLGLSGCVEESYHPIRLYPTQTFEFCDDYGCRWVTAPYYVEDGEIVYWDAHFGVWIGPHGYLHGGHWHEGIIYGYHDYYHPGWYHYHPSYYYNHYYYREPHRGRHR